jgi:hypothetical protein
VHFNDKCCDSVAELRSVILKARRLADDHAEQQRAAAAVRTWLLARIEKKRPAPSADLAGTAPDGAAIMCGRAFPGLSHRAGPTGVET